MNSTLRVFEQYVHTLIPRDAKFAPEPNQVVGFLDDMGTLGALPRNAKLTVMKPSGRVRIFTDPLTGEKKTFPVHDHVPLENSASIPSAIDALGEYSVALTGQGPPEAFPFFLYANGVLFTEDYGFVVRVRLKPGPVSMSDPYGMGTRAPSLIETQFSAIPSTEKSLRSPGQVSPDSGWNLSSANGCFRKLTSRRRSLIRGFCLWHETRSA